MPFFKTSRRLISLALLLFTCSSLAFAFGGKQKKVGKRDLRAEIVTVDEQWQKAVAANDLAAYDKILSDDYLGISGNGQVVTKPQQLDRIRMHAMEITKLVIDDVKIKFIGHRVAVVTSGAEIDGMLDGRVIDGRFQSTRIYQHVASGWKLTNFEVTPMRPYGHPHNE